ncbi:MAG TPA: Wzz/FepE/Etk N-terminal domain-containing protein [Steroidobacteraceae bacterium]|nr:Wzz/FepE/Etk N-terminal domain-containing protein [Steroidobacteraceae bacterium]
MTASPRAPVSPENEIDVVALWWIIWDHKTLVITTTFVCTLVALVLALTATPLYRATVVVTEVHDTGLGSDSGLASQIGGLASLAGLSLGENGPHPERQAVLRSRHLVDQFVRQPDVTPLLMANAKPGDSVWATVERFRRSVLDIQDDKIRGTTTLTIDWSDPEVAARWATGMVTLANTLLRERAIEDSTRNIAYLTEQVQHTSSLEIQRVMYNLIEQETKTLMLAKGRNEYAFAIVDPPVKPEVRVSPKRTLMVLSGIVVGGALGAFIAWARTRFARRRPTPAAPG